MNSCRLAHSARNSTIRIATSAVLLLAIVSCNRPASTDVTETATAVPSNVAAVEPAVTAPILAPTSVPSPTPTAVPIPAVTGGPSRATLRATLLFCKAFSEAERKHHLERTLGIDDLGRSCEALAFDLNNADHKDVLPDFIEWSARYSDLLIDMSECCELFANRNMSDNQSLRMIEAFVRGSRGDPLGVAIEESNAIQLQQQVLTSFEKRRLKLLFEFQRLFNSVAPGGANVQINP